MNSLKLKVQYYEVTCLFVTHIRISQYFVYNILTGDIMLLRNRESRIAQ